MPEKKRKFRKEAEEKGKDGESKREKSDDEQRVMAREEEMELGCGRKRWEEEEEA